MSAAVAALILALSPIAAFAVAPACQGYSGWSSQTNPQTDPTGLTNVDFPEASSTTYFQANLVGVSGAKLTMHGQYPLCRFMSFEVYSGDQLVDFTHGARNEYDLCGDVYEHFADLPPLSRNKPE